MKTNRNRLINSNDGVGFITALIYSLPSIPITSAQFIVYILIPPIFSVMPNVGIALTGLAIMLSRIVDMISDPLMGTFLDRLVSTLGWKIWLVLGFPFITTGIYLLLNPIREFEVASLFFGLVTVTLGWTFFSIPWWSIGIYISGDSSNKRFKLVSVRELLTIPGIILGLLIAYFSDISSEIYLIASLLLLTPILIKKIPIPKPNLKESNSFLLSVRNLFETDKNFKNLCLAYLFIGLSNGITSILFILFVENIIGVSPLNFLIIYFGSAFLGLPIIYSLGLKFDKQKVWVFFIILACITFIPVYFLSYGDTYQFMTVCILSGFCLGADLILPASIQANIVFNAQETKNSVLSGKIYSVWSLIQKLSLALSAGICLPAIGYFGFNPSEGQYLLTPLSFAYGIMPIILRLPAIFFASNLKKN